MKREPYYPTSADEATADRLAKHAVDRAVVNARLADAKATAFFAEDHPTDRSYLQHIGQAVNGYTTAKLLRILADIDQRTADAVARELWLTWEAGEPVMDAIDQWAHEYGIPVGP